MRTPIEVVTVVDAPAGVVFDLELDVEAHAASLPGTGETATTSTGRPDLGPGDEVTFRARHLGSWWTMTARITAHERPHRFVDEQVRGPFRALRHEHVFEALDGGATRMTDRMTAELPFGPLGRVAVRLVLAPYLRRLLRRRAAHIKRAAEGVAAGGRRRPPAAGPGATGVRRYFVGHLPDGEWLLLRTHLLDGADSFAVHVPDGPGPLSHGRAEFSALPGAVVAPWAGMEGAVTISGPLSPRARGLFERIETSLRTFDPEEKLWDYRLLRDGEVVLSIGDFHDLVVHVGPDALARLRDLGVDPEGWTPF